MTIYSNLDEKICINFFSGPKKWKSKSDSQNICVHVGTLRYNGFNTLKDGRAHSIKCSKCEKRFGKDSETRNLLLYQQKIKMILYDLLFLKYPLTGIAKQWEFLKIS